MKILTILGLLTCCLMATHCKEDCSKQDANVNKLKAQIITKEIEIEKLNIAFEESKTKQTDVAELKAAIEKKDAKIATLEKRAEAVAKQIKMFKKLIEQFQEMVKTGKLEVKVKNGKMLLELPSAVLFESGKADLSEEGKITLTEVAKVLKKLKRREFQVAGHTDNMPLGKENPFPTNWHLSAARAVEVVLFLSDNGVKSANLSAAGYSYFQKAASNRTKKGKAKNRRIEIILMPNIEELPDLSELEDDLDV